MLADDGRAYMRVSGQQLVERAKDYIRKRRERPRVTKGCLVKESQSLVEV